MAGAVTKTNEQRFWPKVDRSGHPSGCWIWTGARIRTGYGRFHDVNIRKVVYAHRWSYERFVGQIPDGLQIDHLCKNTSCVNPQHLEPVTCRENLMRSSGPSSIAAKKTHCVNGHIYDHENTYYWNGERRCRACGRANHRKKENRNKGDASNDQGL